MVDADKYNFGCDHYDESSGMTKEFLLTLYVKPPPSPTELSLYDVKGKRMFLKKGSYDPVHLEDLYLGGTALICARKFKITAHADGATRDFFAGAGGAAEVSVGPNAVAGLGQLLDAAASRGLSLRRMKSVRPPQGGSTPAFVVELGGARAVELADEAAKEGHLAGSVQVQLASQTTDELFDGSSTTAKMEGCSVCVIRPHAVREGKAGAVINAVLGAGLLVSAAQSYSLTRPQAEHFCEVYKTILPSAQYTAMITELASGISLALEVLSADGDGASAAVTRLRELCGPHDVEIARHLRPSTLRAQLGRDNVHNAVHCTDMPEDGVLESQYFFSILPGASGSGNGCA